MSSESMTRTAALLLLLLVGGLAAASTATATFTCNFTSNGTCRSLVGFHPSTTTTYGAVAELFQVDLPSLLGANDLPADPPSVGAVQSGALVLVPIRCRCVNGTGRSDQTPFYTVQAGDNGLLNITAVWFGNLTTYQDIAEVNRLPNANNIEVGQRLWIPLPCSCDEVGGEETVHLAHMVEPGSSVDAIAGEFGTTPETIIALNGNLDPRQLQAYQILDVPLRACSSSISNTSLDYYGLRLADHSYAPTVGGCVSCSCSNATYRLECSQSRESSLCPPPATCQPNFFIGNTTSTSTSGCATCAYAGYTNSSAVVNVSAVTVTGTNCNDRPSLAPSLRMNMKGMLWSGVALLVLHIVYVYFQ